MTPSGILPVNAAARPGLAARVAAVPERGASPVERVAALGLGLYLALQAMYAHEILGRYGVNVPILLVVGFPVLLLWLMLGQHGRFLRSRVALPYLALLGWWWLCTVIGTFKGEWVGMFLYGIRFHLTPLIFCGIALTFGLFRTVLTGFGWGFVGVLGVCAKYGQVDEVGRFSIPDTSLGNPNDLALHLLIGLAVLTVFAFDRSIWKRLLWFAIYGATVYFVLKTGSRANLLTMAVMLIAVFWLSQARTRVMFAIATLLMGLAMAVAVPKSTWVRLTTFFSFSETDYEENSQVANATASTEARKQLQIRAVKLTLTNPIFGVGPHMFTFALDNYMRTAEGRRKGSWQHPHNTYLDLSSETGFPGLLLYCGVLIWCLRTNYRGLRQVQNDPTMSNWLGISISLLLATVGFAFGTLFCSIPYWSTFCYLVGLTAAANLLLTEQLQRQRKEKQRVAVAPGPVQSPSPWLETGPGQLGSAGGPRRNRP